MNTNEPSIIPSAYHSWKKYLPSPKIRRIIFVLLIIFIIYLSWTPLKTLVYMIKQSSTARSITGNMDTMVTQNTEPLSIDKDSDNDGIPDWQETLIGTDPYTYNDQSEIPQELRKILVDEAAKVATTEDKLALKVYQRLLEEPVGENISEAVTAATTKEMLDLADSIDENAGEYTYDDLEIGENDDTTYTNYYNAIASLSTSLKLDDATIQEIYKTLFTGKKTVSLVTFQMKLEQLTNRMIQTPVPLTLANLHMNLVTAMSRANKILGSSNINPDEPSVLYASFLAFQKNINVINDTVESIMILNK